MASASSVERLRTRASPSRVFTRLRTCQRQSLQSAAEAAGKKVLRKSWLRGELGKRSRAAGRFAAGAKKGGCAAGRSEEHTSELQSLMRISYAVFCLKKKTRNRNNDLIVIQH